MRLSELEFERPEALQAVTPPELRGRRRDSGRLLVSRPEGHLHTAFSDLPRLLSSGDLLVVNESATLPASLPAEAAGGKLIINLSTRYSDDLWLVEPRRSHAQPGPIGLKPGEIIQVAGIPARLIRPYPRIERLWFLRFERSPAAILEEYGTPIRYGYVPSPLPLEEYQTLFSRVPGSAEMPSAARPFTSEIVNRLVRSGVRFSSILLHTGVSSLEVEQDIIEDQPLYPEPFEVSARSARLINEIHLQGGRVVAVGTTVARALETAWNGGQVDAASGFTRLYIHPKRGVHAFEGLLTGFHDPLTSHLALLYAVAGKERVQEAYAEAIRTGYLWHEFGDSHLIIR